MNTRPSGFVLPLQSLIWDLQDEADIQYRRLCDLECELLAVRREYADTCDELAELYRTQNSLFRLYAGSPTTTKPAATETA